MCSLHILCPKLLLLLVLALDCLFLFPHVYLVDISKSKLSLPIFWNPLQHLQFSVISHLKHLFYYKHSTNLKKKISKVRKTSKVEKNFTTISSNAVLFTLIFIIILIILLWSFTQFVLSPSCRLILSISYKTFYLDGHKMKQLLQFGIFSSNLLFKGIWCV